MPGSLINALKNELATALDRGEIQVLFQPQISCATREIAGAEALARWHHPGLGEIGADDLFQIAESANLVRRLSRHIAAQALRKAGCWPAHLTLALNIGPDELAEPGFAGRFVELVEKSGFAAERLSLEITEQVLLDDLSASAKPLFALQQAGVRIALDDFGAGYCNFEYIKHLPLDLIKLDRSMVRGICSNERDLAVLRAIVALADALGLGVVAEGIETVAQRDAIITEGCAYWQGFLNAQPLQNAQMLRIASASRHQVYC